MGLINKPSESVETVSSSRPTETGTYIDVQGTVDTQDTATDPDSSLFDEGIKLLPLKRHFEFDSIRTDVDREFRQISDMAKDMGIKSKDSLMALLKEAEYKIGHVEEKEERVRRVALWMKLKLQANQAFSNLSKLENGN